MKDFEKAARKIERDIHAVDRDLTQAKGLIQQYEVGSYEHTIREREVRKLERKLNDLYAKLDAVASY